MSACLCGLILGSTFLPNVDARRGYSIGVPGLDRSKIELRASLSQRAQRHYTMLRDSVRTVLLLAKRFDVKNVDQNGGKWLPPEIWYVVCKLLRAMHPRAPDSEYIDSDFYSEGRAEAPGYLEATGVRKLLLAELARKQGSFSKHSAERYRFLDNGVGRQPERFIYKNNLRKCINSIGERESGQHYFTSGVPWSKFPSKKFIDSIQDGDGYGPWYQCRDMIASQFKVSASLLRLHSLDLNAACTHSHDYPPLDSRPKCLPPGVRGDIYKHETKASSLFEHVTFMKGGIRTGEGCGGASAEEWMSGM